MCGVCACLYGVCRREVCVVCVRARVCGVCVCVCRDRESTFAICESPILWETSGPGLFKVCGWQPLLSEHIITCLPLHFPKAIAGFSRPYHFPFHFERTVEFSRGLRFSCKLCIWERAISKRLIPEPQRTLPLPPHTHTHSKGFPPKL